jgi:hypothetical protein
LARRRMVAATNGLNSASRNGMGLRAPWQREVVPAQPELASA